MTRRPILLLVNPVAGGKPGSGPNLHADPERLRPEALEAALRERGIEVRLHALSEDDDAGALARSAADDGNDVVVAGGDGTVSGVAAAMIGQSEATLGILAMGSFNNMARGFGIPVTLDQALEVIRVGRSARVDAGWVIRDGDAGRPFFEAAGVGIDAVGFLAVELAERRGLWRAVRSLLRALRLRKSPMRITLDDTAYRTGSPAVTVSNGPYHGAGFVVSAEADPTDGVFDVAVFHGMNRFQVIRHFIGVARRKPRREPRIRQYRAKRVKIEGARRALPAHADGVSIGFTPVTFEVRPGALRVFR
ncbi:MAG: diacylglycerol kinase family lipid kinase [Chloroflexota bacterium]|nr:diacylglycerol kinase family lipid kinase [Chloroflexota bacterium]